MTAVIYARYSSSSQREASIEEQVRMVQVIPTEKNGYSHLLRVSVLSLCPADCPWTVRGQSADSHRMQLFSLTVQ